LSALFAPPPPTHPVASDTDSVIDDSHQYQARFRLIGGWRRTRWAYVPVDGQR
ncbi:hypothetical protein Bpfe_029315, partial [Biomphalaria pfeifferi]